MDEIIACCGLLCSECSAYKATLANDDSLREKTAAEWKKMFNQDVKPEDINCLGCRSDLTFSHCKTCGVRLCSMDKEYENCSSCGSFSCEKLEGILKYAPDARERLQKLRT